MLNFLDKISSLTSQLFPTGRAFRAPKNGWLDQLKYALSLSENRAYNDMLGVLNSILPDNAGFTVDDATDWERRLGIISNSSNTLPNRMAAIKRKINHPGTIKARQHFKYIEGQLQAANFPVFVYENRFPDGMGGYITRDPLDVISGAGLTGFQHNDHQHGDAQHGGAYSNIIANHIDESLDQNFFVASLRNTFFIGGNPLGTFANIPAARHDEFRQLILKLKPVQIVGYLLVNYI